MDIASSRKNTPLTPINTSTYTTDDDYIECLGYCDKSYTSENLPLNDETIPLMLRATAKSPFYEMGLKDNGQPYLNHASAVIPAINKAFWVIYPYIDYLSSSTSTDYRDVLQSVQYYPSEATKFGDYIRPVKDFDDYYRPTLIPSDFAEDEKTLDKTRYEESHPTGATYLNLNIPIKITDEICREFREDSSTTLDETRAKLLNFFTNPRTGNTVNVLVCCGGHTRYYKEVQGKKVTHYLPSTALRFYTPTPRIIKVTNKPTEYVYDPIVWQIIAPACQTADGVFSISKRPNIPIGASLVEIDTKETGNNTGQATFAMIGGIAFEDIKKQYLQPDTKISTSFPYSEYDIIATVKKYETVDREIETVVYYIGIEIVATREGNGKKYPACLNGMSQLTFKVESPKDRQYHENIAPTMYPGVYKIGQYIIGYGSEFTNVGDDPGSNAWPKTFNEAIRRLVQYGIDSELIGMKPHPWSKIYHNPLINCQYLHVSPYKTCNAFPLNISRQLGAYEGAIPIPSIDGTKIILLGGVTSKYLNACNSYRYNIKDESSPTDPVRTAFVPEFNEIDPVMSPNYKASDILTIPFFSKIIDPTRSSYSTPYTIGIDTLKYDCLYSQVIQLGNTDYFIAPSSCFTYASDAFLPNATLLKRIQPLNWKTDEKLENMGEIEKHIACNSMVRVSEVINFPVTQETDSELYNQETPACYGRANVAKCSIGVVPDTETDTKGFWFYRLGNGTKPAEYRHIQTYKSVKALYYDTINKEHRFNPESYLKPETSQSPKMKEWTP